MEIIPSITEFRSMKTPMFTLFSIVLGLCTALSAVAAPQMPNEVRVGMLKFLNESSIALTEVIEAAEKVEDAVAAARVIDTYTSKFAPLLLELKALEARFPAYFAAIEELDDDADLGVPEIERARKRFEAMEGRLEAAMIKLFRFAAHPEMTAALRRMAEALGEEDDEDDDY